MSGYVTSLVARALGEAPVLRPRTPSLFEGYSGPATAVEAEADAAPSRTASARASAGEERHAPPVEESSPPVTASTPEEPQLPRHVAPLTPVEAHAQRLQPPVGRAPAPRPPLSDLPLQVARREADHHATEQARGVSRGVPEVSAPSRPQPSTTLGATSAVPATNNVRIASPPPGQTAPPEARHDDVLDATVRTSRSNAPSPVTAAQPAPRLSPTLVAPPRAMATATPASPLSTPPAEPTIRVTIGRVDVRAVVQPAQTRRTTEATRPKLSLDDYLGGGGGG